MADQDKREANAKARCCLAGVAVAKTTDDHGCALYVVSEGAYTRQLVGLDAFLAWVEMRTGRVLGAVAA